MVKVEYIDHQLERIFNGLKGIFYRLTLFADVSILVFLVVTFNTNPVISLM